MKKICLALLAIISMMPVAVMAQGYALFVQTHPVAVQHINGQMRFCEEKNLDGLVCRQKVRLFGKKVSMLQNWWSPETYVQAYTQTERVEVLGVQPGEDGSLVIYYRTF